MRFYAFGDAKTRRTSDAGRASVRRPCRRRRGRRVARRVKALGSNSLKCPVARKKPLRLKNTPRPCPCACVRASTPATQSIAFRILSLPLSLCCLGIILVFMAAIKVHRRPLSFPRPLPSFPIFVSRPQRLDLTFGTLDRFRILLFRFFPIFAGYSMNRRSTRGSFAPISQARRINISRASIGILLSSCERDCFLPRRDIF